jgi:hypothetical protein
MSFTYTYSIANDTANGALAADALKAEYEASAIVTALDSISSSGDDLNVKCKAALSAGDQTILDGVVAAHTGVSTDEGTTPVEVDNITPFAAKTLKINGVVKKLFKRVHGVASSDIASGATVNIDFTVPYAHAKFTGAEIFGCELGDSLKFYVLDTANNDYSGAPTSSPGYPNYILNQFGYDVRMPADRYKNTSDYDADLYTGMIIRCEYTNNGGSTKKIYMNSWLHEVKD